MRLRRILSTCRISARDAHSTVNLYHEQGRRIQILDRWILPEESIFSADVWSLILWSSHLLSRAFAKFAAGFEIVHGVDFHARCQSISYLDTAAQVAGLDLWRQRDINSLCATNGFWPSASPSCRRRRRRGCLRLYLQAYRPRWRWCRSRC